MNKRNFAIIAHIDHGKSTLADRLMQICGAVTEREMKEQMLDTLAVERERGITVKAQTVRLAHKYGNEIFNLNLIDTPGHVDFSYEVRRAISACEGALLLVDATQGIEAQTIAHVYRAMEEDIKLIPVLNKIDLPAAQVETIKQQIQDVLGITDEPSLISAKSGLGVDKLLDRIVQQMPSPEGSQENPFQALLIDCWFDIYLGVVLLVRVKNGKISIGQSFKFVDAGSVYKIEKLGFLTPKIVPIKSLEAGDVGVVIANIRNVKDCIVGDTLCLAEQITPKLKSFPPQKPVVFCGLFPPDSSQYPDLREAIERLSLNDASLFTEPAHSPALGLGFRCGFLGLLHLEVIQQRLEEEFNVSAIVTAPNVEYKIVQTNGEELCVHDASHMPIVQKIKEIYEPWIKVTIFTPEQYLGDVIALCLARRAEDQDIKYLNQVGSWQNLICTYKMPLSEIIFDFHDKLKSISKGYASFDYEPAGEKIGDVVVLNILVNGTQVDALSTIIHRQNSQEYGRWVCEKLKDEIPRQLFAIAIQAAIGGKIIARETVSALRKDVTAKCYGGDVSRKRKLLDKQKEGKKKMKEMSVGNVKIPHSAMLKVLRRS